MPALADRPLAEVFDELAAQCPDLGAGSSTALACATAAALIEMAAAFTLARSEYAERHGRMADVRARASELRREALELAERERGSYRPVLAALGLPRDDPERVARLRDAMSSAADAPLAIAGTGMELATLAAELARDANPRLRGEAIVAALLAEAACRGAAALVEIDLTDAEAHAEGSGPRDPRRARAIELSDRAGAAREQVLS